MDDRLIETIRELEERRNRIWDALLEKRKDMSEKVNEVQDKKRELHLVNQDMMDSLNVFENSDVSGVYDAYLSAKREIDSTLDRLQFEFQQLEVNYEIQYEHLGQEINETLAQYDQKISDVRRIQ